MATAYYSTVFQESAASVWKIIRDFNNYAVWVGGVSESAIEEGKSGDTVGAVRSVHYQGRNIRQRLLALSDVERSQTYEFAGTPTLPVSGFKATLAVLEIVDGDGSFVQWRADFDCEPERREELCTTLSLWFGQWLESLRKEMTKELIRAGSPDLAAADGQRRPFDAILGNLTAGWSEASDFSGYETSSNCCIRGAHLA